MVQVRDRYYLSAVDETGVGPGMYFLAELQTERPPASLEDALNFLKPKVVVVLVLDALNQIEDRDGAPELVWLQPVIPANVRLTRRSPAGRWRTCGG
jgi:hypothetical protein